MTRNFSPSIFFPCFTCGPLCVQHQIKKKNTKHEKSLFILFGAIAFRYTHPVDNCGMCENHPPLWVTFVGHVAIFLSLVQELQKCSFKKWVSNSFLMRKIKNIQTLLFGNAIEYSKLEIVLTVGPPHCSRRRSNVHGSTFCCFQFWTTSVASRVLCYFSCCQLLFMAERVRERNSNAIFVQAQSHKSKTTHTRRILSFIDIHAA